MNIDNEIYSFVNSDCRDWMWHHPMPFDPKMDTKIRPLR